MSSLANSNDLIIFLAAPAHRRQRPISASGISADGRVPGPIEDYGFLNILSGGGGPCGTGEEEMQCGPAGSSTDSEDKAPMRNSVWCKRSPASACWVHSSLRAQPQDVVSIRICQQRRPEEWEEPECQTTTWTILTRGTVPEDLQLKLKPVSYQHAGCLCNVSWIRFSFSDGWMAVQVKSCSPLCIYNGGNTNVTYCTCSLHKYFGCRAGKTVPEIISTLNLKKKTFAQCHPRLHFGCPDFLIAATAVLQPTVTKQKRTT